MAKYKSVLEMIDDIDPKLAAEYELAEMRRDAERHRWLVSRLHFRLGHYDRPDDLENCTTSHWAVRSDTIFKSGKLRPLTVDCAIDDAMELDR